MRRLRAWKRAWRWVVVGLSLCVAADALAFGGAEPLGDPKNGLSSEAFRRNALTTNPTAVQILRSNPLRDGVLAMNGGYLARQLREPAARAVMEELVRCALAESSTLTYDDPLDGKGPYTWRGELGLCQAGPGDAAGDWSRSPPTETCQQLVTACIMARVNGLGMSIPMSLRGPSPRLELVAGVSAVPFFRDGPAGQDPNRGTPIPSFATACRDGEDCRWRARHVGKCRPGAPVELALEAPLGTGPIRVRICGGIHGCTAAGLQRQGAPPRPYSQHLHEVSHDDSGRPGTGTKITPVKLTCPDEVHVGGYYTIMLQELREPDRRVVLTNRTPATGIYPAPESEVFPFREGAFFGNLFDPGALASTCEARAERLSCTAPARPASPAAQLAPQPILPYLNVHACYSAEQQGDATNGAMAVAYLNSRICDRPGSACFPHPPRPCIGGPESAGCREDHSGVYLDCKAPRSGLRTYRPITAYLNEPCDLVGDGASHERRALCNGVRRIAARFRFGANRASDPAAAPSPLGPASPPGPPEETSRRRGGWRGCSLSCSAGGPLWIVAGTALVLILVLRRRRGRR